MDVRPVAVTADSRESRSGVIEALRRIDGVTVVQAELDVADYIVGDNALGIERKAANDFVLSLMDGRLFSQLAQCANTFEETSLILEGDIWSVRTDMLPQAIDGALCHVARGILGVSLVYSTSVAHTARLIRLLGAHKLHGLGYTKKWPHSFEQQTPIFKWKRPRVERVQSCPRRRWSLATNRPTRWATRGAPKRSFYAATRILGSKAT